MEWLDLLRHVLAGTACIYAVSVPLTIAWSVAERRRARQDERRRDERRARPR